MTIPHSTMAAETIVAVVETNGEKTAKMNGHSEAQANGTSDHKSVVEADGTSESESKEASEPLKDPGMACDVKNLYQGDQDMHGRYTWSENIPEDLEEAAENEVTAQYALLIRYKKTFNDSRKTLQIDSIVVQSPLLKKALGVVLAGYPGVTTTLERLIFQEPFKPFVHRWEAFTKAVKAEEDEVTKEHLALLYKILKTELKEVAAAKDDFILNRVITFEHLWTIFQPGCTVHSISYERDCGLKFVQGSYVEHPKAGPCFQITCQQIDWDGEKMGYSTQQPLIPSFGGTRPITDLESFPLEFHPDCEKITTALVARGKLFENFAGYHYKAYNGTAIGMDNLMRPMKINVDERIVVDREAHGRFNPNQHGMLLPLKRGTAAGEFETDDDYGHHWDNGYDNGYGQTPSLIMGKVEKREPLTEAELILCTPLVKGYGLRTKRWLEFFVDTISEIVWNDEAFANLVLPEDQKELILSFAESQIMYKQKFDDFVSGKGKGIIMLLSGSPGVGKTLTAESVAEHMKVPLYMMGASDLGTYSGEVEVSLTSILEMVSKWNAVLLLDECDVFLEARDSHDLERNKLVSIFLRTLEYYQGILFLTTNRADNMDAAFHSRIHISLEYPPLNAKSRRHVWSNFLQRGIEHELKDADLDMLAELDLNGRQIKNVLKTSQLLACRKKLPLKIEHLTTVLQIEGRRQPKPLEA